MTVFKKYFKVAKNYYKTVIIYMVILFTIAIMSSNSGQTSTTSFENVKTKIAIVNHDDSSFIKEFEKYIGEKSDIIQIEDNEKALKDALFFRKVDYIMIIPQRFTRDFIEGRDSKIETMQIPDSYTAMYLKTLMNDYLNLASSYVKFGIKEEDINKLVSESLKTQTKIKMANKKNEEEIAPASYFYNASSYVFLTCIITVIGMMMLSFNDEKIRKRNLISKISYKKINRQLILGNLLVSLIIWGICVAVSFILYSETMLSTTGLLLMLNSIVLVLFVLLFAFLISLLTNNRGAISGITNVVGLGFSFISGAFIPQEYLGKSVLAIAKFTPVYWYVKGNNEIVKLTEFNFESLKTVMINMIIVTIFTLVMYILIQIVSKLKLKK